MVEQAPAPGPPRIWVIGGTSESAGLVRGLVEQGTPCTVTVTTASAGGLYPSGPALRVWVGRLTPESLPQFLEQERIGAILDASHPFAVEISRRAIAAAQHHSLPYLRLERPGFEAPSPGTAADSSNIQLFPDIEALLTSGFLTGQRVLLTLGYRWLRPFRPWQHRATLFARLLPSLPALEAALDAGFTPDRLIALRPPIGAELELALWQQWQISCVVTKASGAAGGEATKRQVARQLGIPLVVLARPEMSYPQQTEHLETALAFCRQLGTGVPPTSKQIR